jgi:hypothetical protein
MSSNGTSETTAPNSSGALSDGRAGEQAAVARADDRQAVAPGPSLGDQGLGDRVEIVERVLLSVPAAVLPPFPAVRAVPAQACEDEQAARLDKWSQLPDVRRHQRDVPAAVAVDERRLRPGEIQIGSVHEEEGDLHTVARLAAMPARSRTAKLPASGRDAIEPPPLEVVAVEAGRDGERRVDEEDLVLARRHRRLGGPEVRREAVQAHTSRPGQGHLVLGIAV